MRPVSRFIGVWKVILADAKLLGGRLLRFQISERIKQQCIPFFFFFFFFFFFLQNIVSTCSQEMASIFA